MFDDYLAQHDDATRSALTALAELVRALVPEVEEGRSYGMPAFRYRGRPLIGFAVHRGHLGVYPFSPEVLATVTDRLEGFEHAKGSVRFTADRPLPDDVVRDLVLGRRSEIDGD